MHAHQYTFDFKQVSNYLNKQVEQVHHVTADQLKEWADNRCFQVIEKEESYRITPETMSIVEEARNLIVVEGHSVEEAKLMLHLMVREKEIQFNEAQKWKLLHEQDPQEVGVFFAQLQYDMTQLSNGGIMALTDTEVNILEKMEKSEDKIRGAIIHSEVRMKNVLELVDKRFQKQFKYLAGLLEKKQGEPTGELHHLLLEAEETRQRHQVELAGVRRKYEEAVRTLESEWAEKESALTKTIEQQSRVFQEGQTSAEAAYDALMQANFFERRKLKKKWKNEKKN